MNRYERRKQWFNILKFHIGCQVCDERHPSTLTFVPIDPARRKFAPGRNITNNIDNLIAEMEQSLLLCANCAKKAQDGVIDLSEFVPANIKDAHVFSLETVERQERIRQPLASGKLKELGPG